MPSPIYRYSIYSPMVLTGHVDEVAHNGVITPYVGTVDLWIKKPSWGTAQKFEVTTDANGNWTYSIYLDEDGYWLWTSRVLNPGGSEEDQCFFVNGSFAPEAL